MLIHYYLIIFSGVHDLPLLGSALGLSKTFSTLVLLQPFGHVVEFFFLGKVIKFIDEVVDFTPFGGGVSEWGCFGVMKMQSFNY